MPDPFRLRVLKALCTRLKTITPGDIEHPTGYYNDLSDYEDEGGTNRPRVVRGKTLLGTEPLPLVSVLEHPAALEQVMAPGGDPSSQGHYPLLIQGWVEDGDMDNPTDAAHVLAAEVVKALALARKERNNILGLGYREPAVMDIDIGSPVVRPPDEGVSTQACFYLAVTLQLAEDLENPFT